MSGYGPDGNAAVNGTKGLRRWPADAGASGWLRFPSRGEVSGGRLVRGAWCFAAGDDRVAGVPVAPREPCDAGTGVTQGLLRGRPVIP